MPRLGASGTKGLGKVHKCGRPPGSTAKETTCDCAWRGKHKGKRIVLATWCGQAVPPREVRKALAVLVRFQAAVDEKRFDPAGELPATGIARTLAVYIEDWITGFAIPNELSLRGLKATLGVIARSTRLGAMSLEDLGAPEAVETIETWLNATGKAEQWKNTTWNDYRDTLQRVLRRAVEQGKLARNPVDTIKRRVARQPDHFKVRHADIEDRLFAVVDQLNQPRPRSTRGKLDQAQADAIRAALAAGETGVRVAQRFQVSAAVVSSIKHGDIWRGDDKPMGTKGREMRRRLIGAFDGGLRAGEMQLVQLQHVGRPVQYQSPDGTVSQGYVITLTPDMTKGGKRTGEVQKVYVVTARFVALVEARIFQLRNNPPSRQFIFGAEDGSYVRDFRWSWHKLFTLAGLAWGRDKGLVWHTARHEFISRVVEETPNQDTARRVARLADFATLKLYAHPDEDRLFHAARGGR